MGLEDMEWSAWPGEWYLDAGVLLLALALDLVLRELPVAIHPVVWTGKLVSWLESFGTVRWRANCGVRLGSVYGRHCSGAVGGARMGGGQRAARTRRHSLSDRRGPAAQHHIRRQQSGAGRPAAFRKR